MQRRLAFFHAIAAYGLGG